MLKQLSMYDFGIDPPSLSKSDSDTNPPSISNTDSDTQPKALLRFLNRAVNNGKGGVGIYQPSGLRKAKYFRFSYRDGSRMKHRHIPGGNIYSKLALERAKQIQSMADREVRIDEILLVIANW